MEEIHMESVLETKISSAQSLVHQLAKLAGITINGNEPWDIQVHDKRFYDAVIKHGSLGFGESYMDKWWDCDCLDILFFKLMRAQLENKLDLSLGEKAKYIMARFLNFQSKERSKQVAVQHYDLDNQLFSAMLGKTMMYSCGYWKEAANLDDAQCAKLDLICQKLKLEPGHRLLDIGCGWGGLAKFAAERYGVSVTAITISEQQYNYAKVWCAGLPVEIRIQDYRDINETYDRIVSVGMFEHVGYLNYPTFMQTAYNALADKGLFLLHTIGNNKTSLIGDEWLNKYIFPNGTLPSISYIGKSIEDYFIMEDWQNFGGYYDNTLMSWHHNFIQHWDELKSKYDERFYRMWTYYLLLCAGCFRGRRNQLWQVVLSKNGVDGVYMAPR
jgi:cyclopropane-fatty-acyl-phospholipid synthase